MRLQGVAVIICALIGIATLTTSCMEKTEQARKEVTTDAALDFIRETSKTSNQTRTSGYATAVRMKALFPKMDTDAQILGSADFRPVTATDYSNSLPFTALDRPAGTVSVTILRDIAAKQCAGVGAALNRVFEETDVDGNSVWMPGETPPSDPESRQATVAVRNVFLYPYLPTSPTVEKITAYLENQSKEATPAALKQEVCLALMLSPQFWIGSGEPYDYVRRISLEIAQKIPTMKIYSDVMTGKLTPEAFVDQALASEGYVRSVSTWFERLLGLERYRSNDRNTVRIPREFRTENRIGNASFFAPMDTGYIMSTIQGSSVRTIYSVDYGPPGNIYSDGAGYCQPKFQEFNPQTSQIQWEQWNRTTSRWEMLVANKKLADGTWAPSYISLDRTVPVASVAGIPGGRVTLEDIGPAVQVDTAVAMPASAVGYPVAGGKYDKFMWMDWDQTLKPRAYPKSKLIGTVFDNFYMGDLRVRRFDNNGLPQDGYSRVKLPFTGEEAYVCNNLSRIQATCSFRLKAGQNSAPAAAMASASYRWTANGPNAAVSYEGQHFHQMTFMVPAILDQYRCGVPNLPQVELFGQASYNEDLAFPKTLPYQDIAFNTRLNGGTDGPTYGAESLATKPEAVAYRWIADDLDKEPTRLVEYLVRNKKDFRQLVTAPYTLGRRSTELFMRMQGYPLIAYPYGNYSKPGDSSYLKDELVLINSLDAPEGDRGFEPIPGPWLRNGVTAVDPLFRTSGTTLPTPAGVKPTVLKLTELKPRPMSGILTQMAFILPMGPKIRSLSARVFQRLLCVLPSGIRLTEGEAALHEQYMFQNPQHLDKISEKNRNCYQCHLHLDPLGMALAKGFADGKNYPGADLERIGTTAIGEIIPFGNAGAKEWWGIRGTSEPSMISTGAFLGKEVHGVREVGQVLANSPIFHRCMVEQTFENVFGRKASFLDAEFIVSAQEHFGKNGFEYSALVKYLLLSKEFQEGR